MADLNGITITQGVFREIKHNINEIVEYDKISTNGITRQISFKTVDDAIIFDESFQFDIVYLTQAEQNLVLAIDKSNSVTFTPYDIGGYYVYTCTCSVNPFYFFEKGQKILSIHVNLEVISKTRIQSGSIFLQDIDELRDNLSASLTLDQNLDFNDDYSYDQTDPDWETKKTAWTTGTGWQPIPASSQFSGNLNGAGFTISNLFINRPAELRCGLFAWINSGVVQNLGLVNVNITGKTVDGAIGALVGSIAGGASITNCFATGSLSNSLSIGGLVGTTANVTITNSYAACSISGAGANHGGLVGYKLNLSVNSCYYDSDVSGESDTGYGTPKTTIQMKQQSTFTSWNFSTIWDISEGSTYPFLRT